MRIQHNIMAMNAYRNYTNNVSAMKKNLEKLSSGYKINRAGDDAAGLAISEKMRAQITGLETAQKNAKDGISLVQTAEGALTEVHDMLNRMVELATQSANGTYDNTTDRKQLQKELSQLTTEINRIADSANFNGIKLLDGTMAVKSDNLSQVQVNAIHDGTTTLTPEKRQFTVNFQGFNATTTATGGTTFTVQIGGGTAVSVSFKGAINGTDVAKQVLAGISGGVMAIDGISYDVTLASDGMLQFTSQDYPSAVTSGVAITVSLGSTDGIVHGASLGGTAGNNGQGIQVTFQKVGAPAAAGVLASASFALSGVKDGTALKIGDTTYVFAVGKDSKYKGSENVVDLTAYESSQAGLDIIAAAALSKAAESNTAVKVEANGNDNVLKITEKEGGLDRSKWDVMGASAGNIADATWKNFVQQGTISGNGLTLQIGDTAESFNQLRVSIGDTHAAALGLDTIDISTQEGAATAVDVIKAAINTVSDIRGTLGATQNRLDHTINNLSVMTENIQDAESTIRDVDVAEEMMAYTKNNILIQSAQAMLAQANQVPQGVLQLLQ